jgi:hypothetical protein
MRTAKRGHRAHIENDPQPTIYLALSLHPRERTWEGCRNGRGSPRRFILVRYLFGIGRPRTKFNKVLNELKYFNPEVGADPAPRLLRRGNTRALERQQVSNSDQARCRS